MPRVSVIIPTYNRAALIGETLQSVLDQTYADFELIVIDDGSTDNTAEVVGSFADARITYQRQENGGVCSARNLGFRLSRGEYVSFLDSDDLMLPNNLEKLLQILEESPEVDVAYGWQYLADDQGRAFGAPWGASLAGEIFSQLVLEETLMMGASLIRRACVEAIGGFDGAFNFQEHWYFYLRLARAGYQFAYTRTPILVLRMHPEARSEDTEEMLQHRLAILDHIYRQPTDGKELSSSRDHAFYRAYVDWAVVNFVEGYFDLGLKCTNSALQHATMPIADIQRIIRAAIITHYPVPEGSKFDDPIQWGKELFCQVRPNPQQPRIYAQMIGCLCSELTFKYYQEEETGKEWRTALKAFFYDPGLLKNRGLLRIAFEGLVGPAIFDRLQTKRFPLNQEMIERLAGKSILFISPHFDDVVLSIGGALSALASRKTDITLITVFTADAPAGVPLRPLARQLHESWSIGDQPFQVRRQEDKATVDYLGIKHCWLEFLDVIYRDPAVNTLNDIVPEGYDPYSDPDYLAIKDALLEVIKSHPGAVVFAPLGVGHHRDHLVIFQALEDVKASPGVDNPFFYYEDYPYSETSSLNSRLKEISWEAKSFSLDISDTLAERIHLIEMHKSQLRDLFFKPERVSKIVTAYAHRVGTKKQPRERVWYDHQKNDLLAG